MHQTFGEQITSTTLKRIWYREAPVDPSEQGAAGGTLKPQSAILWNLVVEGRAVGSSYSGAVVEVRWSLGGGQQVRRYTLGATGRRWRGMATGVEVWAALLVANETIAVNGGAGWLCSHPCCGGAAPVRGTNRVATKTLSITQATTDDAVTNIASLGASQEETRRFMITSGPLTGGSAMVPVTVTIYGQRFTDNLWVPQDSMVVDRGVGGGNQMLLDVVPGQFDNLGYQVTGFPAANGGSTTMDAWEELDSEGC